MPWKESHIVEERMRFVSRALAGERITDLAAEYGISRKTANKFLSRYQSLGILGLEDQSRGRKTQPRRTSSELEELVLALRERHPTWGPKKLKAALESMHAGVRMPASSTIGDLLSRHGLVRHRRRGMRRSYSRTELTQSQGPNDVWCVDFKGQFRLGNGRECYPLTATDHHSRYLLSCEALEGTAHAPAQATFEAMFERYGVPKIIRSDNGVPFSSVRAPLGLSRLSVWWLKLGIQPERIEPGCPEQNGRHERFHRTLKEETTRPAKHNILQQQERFEEFAEVYNHERPHEALGQKTPASQYQPATRTFAEANRPLEYPLHDVVRRITRDGTLVHWPKHRIYVSTALAEETVGLRQISEHDYVVTFAETDIGYINRRDERLQQEPVTGI